MSRIQAILIVLITISLGFSSTERAKTKACGYKVAELIESDSSMGITVLEDNVLELNDKVPHAPSFYGGTYRFDGNSNLRFYGFFVDSLRYRYSELYDSDGNLIETEGSPLLEYRICGKDKDSVLINVSLFALQKKYADLQIITNFGDTIVPPYLYKNPFFSNVKFFPFKLKLAPKMTDLVCYAEGTIQNTCTLEQHDFFDTTRFTN